MKFKNLIIFILLNILIPTKSLAEELNNAKFENISIEQGLSNENVTSIFQDSKGYMWIGTQDGLNRYDGNKIKIYNCSTEYSNTLSSTYIVDIEEDCYGNIWIATDNGLDILDTNTGIVTRMKDIDNKYKLGDLQITSILRSNYEEHIMWVGTEDGLMRIDVKNKMIKAFYHDEDDDYNSLTSSSITCLEEDEFNNIWVGTKLGVNIIDKNLDKKNIDYDGIQKDKLYISHLSKDNLGNISISTKQSTYKYNIRNHKNDYILEFNSKGIGKYSISEKKTENFYNFGYDKVKFYKNFIFNDSKNNSWISSSHGALRYSKDKNKFEIFEKDSSFKYSITSNNITCFYEDSNGTIWIGTDKGVNILNDNTIFNNINKADRNIVSILQHNGYVWVATKFKGIHVYDEIDGHLVKVMYEEKDFTLSDRYIRSLFELDDDFILIVTNKEIIYYNTKEDVYTEVLVGDDYSSEISYTYSDGENIWIASTTDFYSYNIKSKNKTYYNQNMEQMGINPGHIKYILQDNKDENTMWLGGVNTGLIKYNKQKGIIEIYNKDDSNKNFLINDYINCMTFDNSGNLWIGTNVGLSKFDINTNTFTSYTTSEGLNNNFINSIIVDDSGDIWISTNKGLSKFDTDKNSFINFTKMDGLYGYQFNLNSSVKLKSGTIIVGGTEGFTYFNPRELGDYKKYKNDVVLGDIYIGKEKIVYDGKELVLEHDYKDLYVNYFLPNYESLNNITYEYMLEGIDSDWIYVDSRNSLDFKSLDPGKYTLKIRARDGHGELSKETAMNIRIKNTIWQTPLAYLMYLIVILALIIYIFNYVKILHHLVNQKTMKLNKQFVENERLSKEIIDNEKFKNNYFVNLSHELRTPINVIVSTVQLINSISKNKQIEHEKLNQYMGIISKSCENLLKIISDIIDSSKIETGKYKINKRNNDIVYIVEEAALNMSKFIEDKGLSLIIEPDMEEQIISCDEIEIERCIINLLGNAVKFTEEGGEIRVYIKEVETNIEIIIEDTGI
ncbi:MAG: ligand-binding sensor domain-containing protein, partial [Peptostreptococcaceae bacterium]